VLASKAESMPPKKGGKNVVQPVQSPPQPQVQPCPSPQVIRYDPTGFEVHVIDAFTAEFDWSNTSLTTCRITLRVAGAQVFSVNVQFASIKRLVCCKLTPRTTYFAEIVSNMNPSEATSVSFNTPAEIPRRPPIESVIQIYNITGTSAKISWVMGSLNPPQHYNDHHSLALTDLMTNESKSLVVNASLDQKYEIDLADLEPGRTYRVEFSSSISNQNSSVVFSTCGDPRDDQIIIPDDEIPDQLIPEPKDYQKLGFGRLKFTETKEITKGKLTNILIIGPLGSGKSSFINTLSCATGGRPEIARVSADRDHGTDKLQKYPIKDSSIFLWDCWGFSSKNFDGVMLNEILDGHFQSGKNMFSGFSPNSGDFNRHPNSSQAIHNVIFVLAATDLDNNTDFKDKIKEFADILFKKDFNPVVVITKIDLLDSTLARAPERVYSSKIISKAMYKASKLSGVSLNKIFPLKNYHFEQDRNIVMESAHQLALYHACKSAQYFPDSGSVGGTEHVKQEPLADFLKAHGLNDYRQCLGELGVINPRDLRYIEESDLVGNKFKPVSIRKLLDLKAQLAHK
jgi:putative ribosome biogenesis GTPase RsgA